MIEEIKENNTIYYHCEICGTETSGNFFEGIQRCSGCGIRTNKECYIQAGRYNTIIRSSDGLSISFDPKKITEFRTIEFNCEDCGELNTLPEIKYLPGMKCRCTECGNINEIMVY